MTCADVRNRLDDLADGALPLPERRSVETHLATCAACRAEWEALRALLGEAAALPERVDPPRDLWPAIDRGIDAHSLTSLPTPRARPWARVARRAAAAVVLVAASSAATLWLAGRDEPPGGTLSSAGGPVLAAEADYREAAADLERVLRARRDLLRPETVAILERNLAVIDDAIAEARAALARDPANQVLTDRLLGVHAMKVDLLRRAVEL